MHSIYFIKTQCSRKKSIHFLKDGIKNFEMLANEKNYSTKESVKHDWQQLAGAKGLTVTKAIVELTGN